MLYSMTGYGRAESSLGDRQVVVEVRSLNGKQFDLRMMVPSILKPYEIDIRNLINSQLERGSVECNIHIRQSGSNKPVTINTELLKGYYQVLESTAKELQLDTSHLLPAILKLPEVVVNSTDVLQEDDWIQFQKIVETAISHLQEHRKAEGKSLEEDLELRIKNIELYQQEIQQLEPIRREKMKEGLKKLLEDAVGKDNYDANRLEQELIYYIEKMDISEEQVRLNNHCTYFKKLLAERDMSKGKKLSFLLQEIGREINTTGSKAYDADIQQWVVKMKDELEKAKEQVLNVL